MMDIEMAEAYGRIVDEIDAGYKKLEDWHKYYADEKPGFHSENLTEGYDALLESIGKNVSLLKRDVIGLKMGQVLIGLYGLASVADEQD